MDIVLTGSMEPNKNTIKEALEKQGATIKSSVSKTTDLVAYGENAGSKLTKAKKLNINTLYYKEITK
jgi:DNA ligase (NAD+)